MSCPRSIDRPSFRGMRKSWNLQWPWVLRLAAALPMLCVSGLLTTSSRSRWQASWTAGGVLLVRRPPTRERRFSAPLSSARPCASHQQCDRARSSACPSIIVRQRLPYGRRAAPTVSETETPSAPPFPLLHLRLSVAFLPFHGGPPGRIPLAGARPGQRPSLPLAAKSDDPLPLRLLSFMVVARWVAVDKVAVVAPCARLSGHTIRALCCGGCDQRGPAVGNAGHAIPHPTWPAAKPIASASADATLPGGGTSLYLALPGCCPSLSPIPPPLPPSSLPSLICPAAVYLSLRLPPSYLTCAPPPAWSTPGLC